MRIKRDTINNEARTTGYTVTIPCKPRFEVTLNLFDATHSFSSQSLWMGFSLPGVPSQFSFFTSQLTSPGLQKSLPWLHRLCEVLSLHTLRAPLQLMANLSLSWLILSFTHQTMGTKPLLLPRTEGTPRMWNFQYYSQTSPRSPYKNVSPLISRTVFVLSPLYPLNLPWCLVSYRCSINSSWFNELKGKEIK